MLQPLSIAGWGVMVKFFRADSFADQRLVDFVGFSVVAGVDGCGLAGYSSPPLLTTQRNEVSPLF
ncbi:hypothetical protein ACFPAG_18280, partial [Vogesella sp. GCM10023246]